MSRKHLQRRDKIKRNRRARLRKYVRQTEKLAALNGGILPNTTFLMAKGYSSLYRVIKKNPLAFAHIPQEARRTKKPHQQVAVAEQLAQENGGRLPSPQRLIEAGYEDLYRCKQRYPHLFEHIPQESLQESSNGRLVSRKSVDSVARHPKRPGPIVLQVQIILEKSGLNWRVLPEASY